MPDQSSFSFRAKSADGTGAYQAEDSRGSRFDPPSYFSAVHVPGYNVLTSIAAARRRQDRRRKAKAFPAAVGTASATPHRNAIAQPESDRADPLSRGRQEDRVEF
jgi:hypothetical protein